MVYHVELPYCAPAKNSQAGAAPRRMSAAFAQPAMGAPRAPAPTMQAMDNLKTLAKELNPVVGYPGTGLHGFLRRNEGFE